VILVLAAADRMKRFIEGTDRGQSTLLTTDLDVVADRGCFSGVEILECDRAGITVTLPKPMTSNAKAEGRFGKQDFRYVTEEDVYICPAREKLVYHYGLVLRRYRTKPAKAMRSNVAAPPARSDG
jgi:hypothetical protein